MRLMSSVLVLVCAASSAWAQTNAPQIRKLSLDDCVTTALAHNFDVQIMRYNPQIARYLLNESYGTYDPTFSFSGQHDYSRSPGGVDSQGRVFSGSEMDSDSFASGLSGMLPWGLSYNLGANVSDRWGTRPGAVSNPNNPIGFTTNFFTDSGGNPVTLIQTNYGVTPGRFPFESSSGQAAAITLSQPLLKNFWIDAPRYQIFFNKRELKKSEADFRDQMITTITSVETAYYNLIFAEENVRVQVKALELANQLLAENKKRVEVGALAPLNQTQAQSQAASSQADLLVAEAERDTAQRVLKDLLSDNYTNEWADVVIAPADPLLAMPQRFDLQESWRKGLAQGPRNKLQQARLTVEQRTQSVRLQRNQLFPQVDVIGSYGYSGAGQEYSDVFSQIGDRSNPQWAVGGQLSIPLGWTSARNAFKSARAQKEQSVLQLKQGEQKTLIQIENDIGTARSDFERVSATRQATLYAEAALDAEQKILENGKSTSFVVLQLQSQLTTARVNEIRALADYNIALAVLAYDEGSTLERRRISLQMK